MEEIRLKIETSEGFSDVPGGNVQPNTTAQNPLKAVQSVVANVPYGETVAQGLGAINQISGLSSLSTFGAVTMALGLLKTLHTVTKNYVSEVRQSNELQRRAGFKRRDE
ncbi:MAG: hypothetical protein RR458_01220 [Clostridia bacterium]